MVCAQMHLHLLMLGVLLVIDHCDAVGGVEAVVTQQMTATTVGSRPLGGPAPFVLNGGFPISSFRALSPARFCRFA